MRQRCNNPNSKRYYTHGARGIKVCERWNSFESFLEDMGLKPDGYTIERVDNEKGYNPENCKWATPKEQARNRRTNIVISFAGKSMVLIDWAKEIGISFSALQKRLRKWPIERALTESPNKEYIR